MLLKSLLLPIIVLFTVGCGRQNSENDGSGSANERLLSSSGQDSEEDTPEFTLHSWGNYHWARQSPQFTLNLGDNLTTAAWKDLLVRSSTNWNTPTIYGALTTPMLTNIVTGNGGRKCRSLAGTTQVCNGSYGKNGWLGLASITISGVHITSGTAKMNDTYFSTTTYNNPNEKLHVICQEIAHTFGLGHQSENGSSQNSCMDYFSNTGINATSTLSTTPNAHDFEELNAIYAHLDTTTTVAVTAPLLNVTNSEDSANWGKLKSQSQSGRSSVYERRHSDNDIVLTHVYWTEEASDKCTMCDHRYEE